MKIVSVDQMKAIEHSANAGGISYDSMMFQAGKGVADWVMGHLGRKKCALGLVGSGNNGGDTLIALTRLAEKGIRTFAFLVRPRGKNLLIEDYQKTGGVLIDLTLEENLPYLDAALGPGVVLLDGMLGTGFRLPLQGSLSDLMTKIQEVVKSKSGLRVIAIDCPSGVDCDSGEATAQALKAHDTLTMAAVKQGLLREPANGLTGQIHLMDIGIGAIEAHLTEKCPILMDDAMATSLLLERPDTGHKGTFGTCLVIAGTRQYTGAAFLAGKAAYRAGCGLVHVATTSAVRNSLAGRLIEAVWTVLPDIGDGYDVKGVDLLANTLSTIDSLVIGPGWGLHASNSIFLERVLPNLSKELPVVFDADGLKLLGRINNWWKKVPVNSILTPHPGEMAQITGLSISKIQSNRWEIARQYAQTWGVTLILKGALTAVALPDGDVFILPFHDSALGTAGSGDVLTGIIGGLLAQGMITKDAALLGAWLHGTAGVAAHHHLGGPESVTALDILEEISEAYRITKRPVNH